MVSVACAACLNLMYIDALLHRYCDNFFSFVLPRRVDLFEYRYIVMSPFILEKRILNKTRILVYHVIHKEIIILTK
jgi:hypothetical protein